MTLEEAIKTALKFENKVAATYEEAMDKATDPVGKRVFGVLAKEEVGHVQYLEGCLKQWQESGKLIPEKLESVIPSVERIDQQAKQLQQGLAEKRPASSVEVDLLNRALQAEVETSNFYQQMASELDGEGQELFARFLEIEQGHQGIVQAEIDSVTGLGFWFDVPEFSHEAG